MIIAETTGTVCKVDAKGGEVCIRLDDMDFATDDYGLWIKNQQLKEGESVVITVRKSE